MLLDIRKSKSGSAMVLTDPGGDVHACTNAEELWSALNEVMDDPDMPKAQTIPPPPRDEDGGGGGGGGGRTDPESIADALLQQYGGRVVEGLLGGLRKVSHRDGGKKSHEAGGGGG